jgi:arylsulfatase A-like enzyme
MRNTLIKTLAAGIALTALPAWAQEVAVPVPAPVRPNILFIVADDLGWADVGWHGGKFKTPNLDKLVRAGVEMDRHYVQPVCSPTRAALLSGRWTSRWGTHVLSPTNLRAFPPGTTTLASALKEAG